MTAAVALLLRFYPGNAVIYALPEASLRWLVGALSQNGTAPKTPQNDAGGWFSRHLSFRALRPAWMSSWLQQFPVLATSSCFRAAEFR